MKEPISVVRLTEAGPIAALARAGHPPFDIDDPIEITFASGEVLVIDIGFVSATDIQVFEGPLLECAFGHLRSEEPETFAEIAKTWSAEPIDLPWLIGATLANPRRLRMTNPYATDVGYAFDAGDKTLALFGDADLIYIAALDDPEIAGFALTIGEPYSAA